MHKPLPSRILSVGELKRIRQGAQSCRQSGRQRRSHSAPVPIERDQWPPMAGVKDVVLDCSFECVVVGNHEPSRISCGFNECGWYWIAGRPQLH
jgi:hypothetical protein